MKKIIKLSILSLLMTGIGWSLLPSATGMAKSQAAKILSTQKIKKVKFHPSSGPLYRNARLTKKSKLTFKPVKTTFYATKAVKVKKANGHRATYYYVKNKRGNIHGWLWKGHLSRTKDRAQRLADIRGIKAAVKLMPKEVKVPERVTNTDATRNIHRVFRKMKVSDAYKTTIFYPGIGLPDVVLYMSVPDKSGFKPIAKAYSVFKGRFRTKTNQKLAKLYTKMIKSGEVKQLSDSRVFDASTAFVTALAKAISTLK